MLKFRSWKVDEKTISQLAVPVYIYYPVSNQLTIRVTEALGFSSIGDRGNLNGLSDAKIRASYRIMDDTVLLAAGLGLPIGKNALNVEQAEVADMIYTDDLDFGIRRLGEGFVLNLAATTAQEIDKVVIGAGAGYLFKGAYKTTADVDTKYNPGDEFNLTGGLNWKDEQISLRTDIIYTLYTTDKIDGDKTFKQGNQLTAGVSFTYRPQPPISISVLGRDTMIAKNAYAKPSGELETEPQNTHGNRLNLSCVLGYALNEPITLYGMFGINSIGRNGYDRNDASILTFGAGMRYALDTFILNGALNYSTGSRDNGGTDISGFGLDLGVNYRF